MYETFFGLKKRPFSSTPNPSLFVPLKGFEQVLQELVVCVEGGEGIAILTAPAGTGKTLVCQKLVELLEDTFQTVFLYNANFQTRRAFLQAVLYELGQPYERMDEQELRLELTKALKSAKSQQQRVVLVIDEAHLLDGLVLEEIRTLTNLAEHGTPLIRVVLSGQLQLEETLTDAALSAFNQRIQCHLTLNSLTRAESAEYLAHRIRFSGGTIEDLFFPDSVDVICYASDGIPRCLNQLADHCLLLAYVVDEKPVSPRVVHEALEDLKQLPLHWNQPTREGAHFEQATSDEPISESEEDMPAHHPEDLSAADTQDCFEVGSPSPEPAHQSAAREPWDSASDPMSSDEEIMAYEVGSMEVGATSAVAPQPPAARQESESSLAQDEVAPIHSSDSNIYEVFQSMPVGELIEEIVVDHYAALDARIAGDIGGVLETHRADHPPIAKTAPAPVLVDQPRLPEARPVRQPDPKVPTYADEPEEPSLANEAIDEIIPLSDEEQEDLIDAPQLAQDPIIEFVQQASTETHSEPSELDDPEDYVSIEDQIRAQIEGVRGEIGHVHDDLAAWEEDELAAELMEEEAEEPDEDFWHHSEQYDVIQPDDHDPAPVSRAREISQTTGRPASAKRESADSQSGDRPPHFEQLFSRLRRRTQERSARRD